MADRAVPNAPPPAEPLTPSQVESLRWGLVPAFLVAFLGGAAGGWGLAVWWLDRREEIQAHDRASVRRYQQILQDQYAERELQSVQGLFGRIAELEREIELARKVLRADARRRNG